ncbi:hypothetical protein MMC11_007589 [Xylographa trunciseda]|nr:hypothetical protein [Xylographa trunciseda]
MPTFYDSIPADLGEWALSQPLLYVFSRPLPRKYPLIPFAPLSPQNPFPNLLPPPSLRQTPSHSNLHPAPTSFVASAPLHSAASHVNVSPKGLPAATLTILSPTQCAYLDSTGSGCETIAHVYENGRVTLMFASFGASPRICRFFCKGRVVEWDDAAFAGWVSRMGKGEAVPGTRAVVVLDVWQVQTSCGWGVPLLSPSSTSPSKSTSPSPTIATTHLADRPTMSSFARKLTAKHALRAYQAKYNDRSLDGLPGLRVCRRDVGERLWLMDGKVWARRVGAQWEGVLVGVVVGWVVLGAWVVLGGWA